MTESVQVALIATVPLTITALTGFIVVWREVRIVHKTINSKLDKWLEVERTQGVTEGRQKERQDVHDSQAQTDNPSVSPLTKP